MIHQGAIVFAGSDWTLPALIAAAIAAALVLHGYIRSPIPAPIGFAGATLKLLGIALLLLCLLEPTYTGQRAKPGANLIAVLADNSRSLRVTDAGDGAPRSATQDDLLLGTKNQWRETLAESFEVRNWIFDSRLQATEEFGELNHAGRASGLGNALKSLANRYRGQPVAGVIVLTDGIATDLDDLVEITEGLPPIHPVVLGRDTALREIAITGTSVSQTTFEDAPVTVLIEARAEGFGGREIVAELAQGGSATNAAPIRQTQRVPTREGKVSFRFQFKPVETGCSSIRRNSL